MKLVLNVLDKTDWPIKVYCLLSSDQHPQQTIKADEMIDMRVRDKDMLKALNFSRRQIRDVTYVEQDCAFFEQRFDVEGGISGSPVDEAWVQKRPHAK